MNNISNRIKNVNDNGAKALSIFLTAGYPDKDSFVDLALKVYDAGADMIELGIPFSDPLADGPVIQKSYEVALTNGVDVKYVLNTASEIKKKNNKPLILMGSANPIAKYGIDNFINDARNSGVDGLIVPDVPLEEYDDFFADKFNDFEIILLTTPTSPEERIKEIDKKSSGFLYCVSVTGITGIRQSFGEEVKKNLERTYKLISKNKMMIGFGISSPENIKEYKDFTDGFIVGSAVVKSLSEDDIDNYSKTTELIKLLSKACVS